MDKKQEAKIKKIMKDFMSIWDIERVKRNYTTDIDLNPDTDCINTCTKFNVIKGFKRIHFNSLKTTLNHDGITPFQEPTYLVHFTVDIDLTDGRRVGWVKWDPVSKSYRPKEF